MREILFPILPFVSRSALVSLKTALKLDLWNYNAIFEFVRKHWCGMFISFKTVDNFEIARNRKLSCTGFLCMWWHFLVHLYTAMDMVDTNYLCVLKLTFSFRTLYPAWLVLHHVFFVCFVCLFVSNAPCNQCAWSFCHALIQLWMIFP